jgi:hypothetical protein
VSAWNPFVLFAHLHTQLAVTKAMHLDGMLLAARERAEGVLDLDRPLDCVAVEGGVYRASAGLLLCHEMLGNTPSKVVRTARFRTETRETLSYFRLHDADGKPVHRKERTLPESNSPWKPHFAEKLLHSAVATVAWQFVGDPHKVLRLARHLDCIGPSSNQGYGRVRRWSVEPCEAEPDAAGWYAGDRILRNLPVALAPERLRKGGPGSMMAKERVAPPYWDPNDKLDCLSPIPRALVVGYDEGQARLGLAA